MIAFIVLVCGASLLGLIYILFSKPSVPVTPGVVVSSPSPVATPHLPFQFSTHSPITGKAPAHVPGNKFALKPKMTTPSGARTSIWTLSSAKISNSGSCVGSSNGNAHISSGNHVSPQRGITTTSANVAMPMSTFIALASTRMVAEPDAQQAPQMAKTASIKNAPPPPDPGTGLDEDHQLVEHPIGDFVLPLLIFAMGYIVYKRKRLAM